jgi:hypothetical protein
VVRLRCDAHGRNSRQASATASSVTSAFGTDLAALSNATSDIGSSSALPALIELPSRVGTQFTLSRPELTGDDASIASSGSLATRTCSGADDNVFDQVFAELLSDGSLLGDF